MEKELAVSFKEVGQKKGKEERNKEPPFAGGRREKAESGKGRGKVSKMMKMKGKRKGEGGLF